MSAPGDELTLAPKHARMLAESGIAPEVIAARGYRTVVTRAELQRLGFSRSQSIVPTLLVPLHNTSGDVVNYQHRADTPRANSKGKPIKYETVAGSQMLLDVPPGARRHIGDPRMPLFVTEGAKKADAAVSRGLCCIALLGVWNWRGRNAHGGTVALSDWESIALKGRDVCIAFDSDVVVKQEVYAALLRLKAFLEGRGATARVIYLPSGENGQKMGLDDYLAGGRSVADLLALATSELRRPPSTVDAETPYRATPQGFIYVKQTHDGPVCIPLTNFTASVASDVIRDDGTPDVVRSIELEATLDGCVSRFQLSAQKFDSMTWPVEHLGSRAITYPGHTSSDHAKVAIQMLSRSHAVKHVHVHTGWREINGAWRYLHAGGAIGAEGRIDGIEVDLGDALDGFRLPAPPTGCARRVAIRASLKMLDVASDLLTVPLLGSCYRVVLGPVDWSGHLVGPTGVLKTALAAVAQQHFGAALDGGHVPTAWSSTGNALEGQAHALKDVVMLVDDFAPRGTNAEQQQLHGKADRLLRAQGNQQGRARMRPDGSLRPTKSPRGLILSTGEEVPSGQSLRARMWIVPVADGDIDGERLRACQREASAGQYASAMAAYLQWLAAQMSGIRGGLRDAVAYLRDHALATGRHRRTPGIVADLALGWQGFIALAFDAGAITSSERDALWVRVWRALALLADAQAEYQIAAEPTARFRELLTASLGSGAAYVAGPKGGPPPDPAAWGWQRTGVGNPEWRPAQGPKIGWVEGDDLYLNRDAAVAVAQRFARDAGDGLAISGHTLCKRLHERGLLRSVEKPHLQIRHMVEGKRQRVLHLDAAWLLSVDSGPSGPSGPPAQSDAACASDTAANGNPGAQWRGPYWTISESSKKESGPDSNGPASLLPAESGAQATAEAGNGPFGPLGPAFIHKRAPNTLSTRARAEDRYELLERAGIADEDASGRRRPAQPVSEPL